MTPTPDAARRGTVSAPTDEAVEAAASEAHWRLICLCTLGSVLAWAAVVWVAVWFAEPLNRWQLAGAQAGYWLAAQGAIGAFLLIIVVHNRIMEGLDRREAERLDARLAGRAAASQRSDTPRSAHLDD
ncbi:MAG: DUF4212 domain-containing protein [Leptothrix sp. (in: b-proteobacteria)]